MNKLAALLRLTRIEHSLMLVIAVLAAELIAKGLPSTPAILAASIVTPVFVCMASFAINDYFDIEVDRKNKKRRPLVTGDLKPVTALYVTGISLAIGIAAAALINLYCLAIAIVFGALAVLYSYRLKELLFWGNAYIAFSMAIVFIFGSYAVTNALGLPILLVTAMIFISGLAREVHGTIRDLDGDVKVRNAHTMPKVLGVRGAASLALALYVVAVLISVYLILYVKPFMLNALFIVLIGLNDVLLLYIGIEHFLRSDQRFYGLARNLSLLAMTLGLVALLLAPLVTFSV